MLFLHYERNCGFGEKYSFLVAVLFVYNTQADFDLGSLGSINEPDFKTRAG